MYDRSKNYIFHTRKATEKTSDSNGHCQMAKDQETFNIAFTCRAVFCRHISDGSTLTRWSGSRDPSHNRFFQVFSQSKDPPPPLFDTLKHFSCILKICQIEPHSLMCSYHAYKTYSNRCVSYSRLEFPGRLLFESASRSHKEGLNTRTNALNL